MIKVGIVGATGYTGIELVRLLLGHPQVELVAATSRSYQGQKLSSIFPHFVGVTDLVCAELNPAELADKCDVVLIALPHGHSVALAEILVAAGKKVVDLGADFRLQDREIYSQWYREEPAAAELLSQAVYGLPELHREKIKKACLIASPGCYPTSSILALAPLVKEKLIDLSSIIIDAKSGVSGAGRSLALGSHYAEVNESFKAYKVANHRHTPEIEQELIGLAGQEIRLSFTPHLVPMTRGILATVYANPEGGAELSQARLTELYTSFYREEKFVQVLEGQLPQTNWVAGTNNCQLAVTFDRRAGRIIILSAIDNLIKGAAGQAIQNMNIMCGLAEDEGLQLVSRFL
jgi:N-acetyl-gamma-glutamyl-phosphate reductase